MSANETQVAGSHYRSKIQHWDYVYANDLDYFQGQITKYVSRWRKKGGINDLMKAKHFLDKYLELAPGILAMDADDKSSDPTQWAVKPHDRPCLAPATGAPLPPANVAIPDLMSQHDDTPPAHVLHAG